MALVPNEANCDSGELAMSQDCAAGRAEKADDDDDNNNNRGNRGRLMMMMVMRVRMTRVALHDFC